jgi:tryptophan synthase alpha subunit
MPRLSEAIAEANSHQRLGLIPYTIPNFPTSEWSQEVLQLLAAEPAVSVIETTVPVTDGFSDHANQTIREAHRIAASAGQPWQEILGELPTTKPLLCVLYQESARTLGWETLLQAFTGRIAGILPEWHEDNPAPYVAPARRWQIEFVTCVGPWMHADEIAAHLVHAADTPLVYLMSAAMTGATLYPAAALERTIETIRRYRPTATIAAGFGIRTADDIRRLAHVRGLNAVIIGTAFLDRMRQGPDAVEHYLNDVKGALSYVDAQ